MKRFSYVMLFVFLFIAISPAEKSEASYCDKKTYVFFGNGMFNEQTIAASGLRKLKRKT